MRPHFLTKKILTLYLYHNVQILRGAWAQAFVSTGPAKEDVFHITNIDRARTAKKAAGR